MSAVQRRARVLIAAAVLATALAGCAVPRPAGDGPLRYRDAVFSSVDVSRDLVYGSAPGLQGTPETLRLDLYQPTGDTAQRRPAYVWVHGGGFSGGDKSNGAGTAAAFARRGYVVVSINYRLLAPNGCGGTTDPSSTCTTAALEAQHDAQAAVRWLRVNAAQFRIDSDRIAIGGSSAGAIAAVLVGWRPEDPGTSGNPGPSSRVRASVALAGGVPINDFIDASDPPTMFFHGTADTVVPYQWAVSNAAQLYRLKVPVALYPFNGAGHEVAGGSAVSDTQSSYFLYHSLGLGSASAARSAARLGRRAGAKMLRKPEARRLLKRTGN